MYQYKILSIRGFLYDFQVSTFSDLLLYLKKNPTTFRTCKKQQRRKIIRVQCQISDCFVRVLTGIKNPYFAYLLKIIIFNLYILKISFN